MAKHKQQPVDSLDGRARQHFPYSVGDCSGVMLTTQIVQDMDRDDRRDWRRRMAQGEDMLELQERVAREDERKYGEGPTSIAAARKWAETWKSTRNRS